MELKLDVNALIQGLEGLVTQLGGEDGKNKAQTVIAGVDLDTGKQVEPLTGAKAARALREAATHATNMRVQAMEQAEIAIRLEEELPDRGPSKAEDPEGHEAYMEQLRAAIDAKEQAERSLYAAQEAQADLVALHDLADADADEVTSAAKALAKNEGIDQSLAETLVLVRSLEARQPTSETEEPVRTPEQLEARKAEREARKAERKDRMAKAIEAAKQSHAEFLKAEADRAARRAASRKARIEALTEPMIGFLVLFLLRGNKQKVEQGASVRSQRQWLSSSKIGMPTDADSGFGKAFRAQAAKAFPIDKDERNELIGHVFNALTLSPTLSAEQRGKRMEESLNELIELEGLKRDIKVEAQQMLAWIEAVEAEVQRLAEQRKALIPLFIACFIARGETEKQRPLLEAVCAAPHMSQGAETALQGYLARTIGINRRAAREAAASIRQIGAEAEAGRERNRAQVLWFVKAILGGLRAYEANRSLFEGQRFADFVLLLDWLQKGLGIDATPKPQPEEPSAPVAKATVVSEPSSGTADGGTRRKKGANRRRKTGQPGRTDGKPSRVQRRAYGGKFA